MIRITSNYMSNNMMRTLRSQNKELDNLQNQISSQNNIQAPHEDPTGTAMLMLYRGKIDEFTRYEKNIEDSTARLNFVDVKLQEINTYLQNIREEAIKGANGTLTKSDREKIAVQIEQYLRQVVQVANSKFKGESIFSGHQTNKEPYKLEYGRIVDTGDPIISKVNYNGDIGTHYREIDRGEYLGINLSGNRAFWSSDQRITSQTVATGYMAVSKNPERPYQIIKIDGVEVRIDDGDNLQTIVSKINKADIPVKAEIDNTSGKDFLVIQTTRPHQLWLEDDQGGSVLQDLGIIAQGGAYPPNNYAPSAIVQGDSLFDSVIQLRNALLNNDTNGINRNIGSIDQSMDNLRNNIAIVGTKQKRLEIANERTSKNIVYAQDIYSKIQGVDVAKAITDLKNVELSHRAALQVGARILQPTLLDFLR
ncbi:MAG: flagellar hook-associated protein 3 [Spirochaetota bacterium]|nr:flagellar hook-associated protein 3 [Spirochaetota bacterium]